MARYYRGVEPAKVFKDDEGRTYTRKEALALQAAGVKLTRRGFWETMGDVKAAHQARTATTTTVRLRSEVEVIRYKSTKDYQRDAERRLAEGWTISGQTQETGRTHRIRRASSGALIGSLFMAPGMGALVGGLSGKRDEGPITVTWLRQPESQPPTPA